MDRNSSSRPSAFFGRLVSTEKPSSYSLDTRLLREGGREREREKREEREGGNYLAV